jgi:hypothetical protein
LLGLGEMGSRSVRALVTRGKPATNSRTQLIDALCWVDSKDLYVSVFPAAVVLACQSEHNSPKTTVPLQAFNPSRFKMPKIKSETPARTAKGKVWYNNGDVQSMYDGGHDSTTAGKPPVDGSENTESAESTDVEGGSIG